MHALGSREARISKAEGGHDSRKGRQDRHKTELRGYRALRGRVLVLSCITTFLYDNVWGCLDMPRYWSVQRRTKRA